MRIYFLCVCVYVCVICPVVNTQQTAIIFNKKDAKTLCPIVLR